jgi:hypothetical protein
MDRRRLIRLARRLKRLSDELPPKEQKAVSEIVALWVRAVRRMSHEGAAAPEGGLQAEAGPLDPVDADAAGDSALVERLVDLVRGADPVDFFLMKDQLSMAASALPVDGTLPRTPSDLHAFRVIQRWLFELCRAGRPGLRKDGIIWRGRPRFMTDDLLQALLAEAADLRPGASRQRWGQFTCSKTKVAQSLSEGADVRSMIRDLAGSIEGVSTAIYLYYDEPGAHVRPHVDGDKFSINMNVMLDHSSRTDATSDLVVYPVDGAPERLRMTPGELVLMYADCIVHTRSPVSAGEIVQNLAMGFQLSNEIRRSVQ